MVLTNKSQTVNLDPIHSFEHPPLIETVLGVQFKRLPKLSNQWLAIFWELLRTDWPNVEESPLIEPQFELFGEERSWTTLGGLNLRISHDSSTRLRITNLQRSRMIQAQNGRFHYNWLKANDQRYPRYSAVRSDFDKTLDKFKQFLAKNSLGSMEADQWEVTYVNHITKGTVWNSPADWTNLFPAIPILPSIGEHLRLDTLVARVSYEIKPFLGRLHMQINHGVIHNAGNNEKKEVIRLDLTARGQINQEIDFDKGLNLGRNAIVNAFFDITSKQAHEYWGYKHAS